MLPLTFSTCTHTQTHTHLYTQALAHVCGDPYLNSRLLHLMTLHYSPPESVFPFSIYDTHGVTSLLLLLFLLLSLSLVLPFPAALSPSEHLHSRGFLHNLFSLGSHGRSHSSVLSSCFCFILAPMPSGH